MPKLTGTACTKGQADKMRLKQGRVRSKKMGNHRGHRGHREKVVEPPRRQDRQEVEKMMLDLLDYRRQVAENYRRVREQGSAQAYEQFRRERDTLFRSHSQSALDEEQKAAFKGLRYAPYDPAFRVTAKVDTNVEPVTYEFDLEGDGHNVIRQFAQVSFELPTGSGTLGLFWVMG